MDGRSVMLIVSLIYWMTQWFFHPECGIAPEWNVAKATVRSDGGGEKQEAKMFNSQWEVGCRVCLSPHTDIGVHLGSVHGMDELPKAFLVAVHLPVSTDEEFPGHVCRFFCGKCLLRMKNGIDNTPGCTSTGVRERTWNSNEGYLWTWEIKPLLSLGSIGLWRHARKRISPFEEGEAQNVMLRSSAPVSVGTGEEKRVLRVSFHWFNRLAKGDTICRICKT